jgi:hypothetical protein
MTPRTISWRRTLDADVDVVLRLLRFTGSVFVGLREGVCDESQYVFERVLREDILRSDLGGRADIGDGFIGRRVGNVRLWQGRVEGLAYRRF